MSEDRLDKALEAMKNENVNAGELDRRARSRAGTDWQVPAKRCARNSRRNSTNIWTASLKATAGC